MLSQINDFLIAQMGPLGPLFAVGVLGIALMAIALPTMLKKRADPFSRLRETSKPTG